MRDILFVVGVFAVLIVFGLLTKAIEVALYTSVVKWVWGA